MKKINLILFSLVNLSICNAQNQGSITTKETKPKAGIENHFVYQPPKNLSIPNTIQAFVIYQNNHQYYNKTIRIDKKNSKYQFSFKAPDSTSVLMFSIIVPGKIMPEKASLVMEKEIVLDNNEEKGFAIYLYDKTGKRFTNEKLTMAALLDDYAPYTIGVKEQHGNVLIKLYEDSYSLYPNLKKENSYTEYLLLLYKEDEVTGRQKLLNYANELIQIKNDEEKWINAARIYGRLNMDEEKKSITDKILITFPNGIRAKGNFWDDYYSKPDTTEDMILVKMNAYITRFNDNTVSTKDVFYNFVIFNAISHKDWPTVFRYENLITNKMKSAYAYDYYEWQFSGKQINNQGADLQNAKILSARAIEINKILIKDGLEREEDALRDLKDAQAKFYETYALILYKLGQHDSAFYYQDLASKLGKELNTGGMERYAAYAEKVKGNLFTKQFIESKLFTGTKSPVMMEQLKGIYKQLNLPEDEFSRLQQLSMLLAKQKSDEAIIAKYSKLQAPDFSLKNMDGETVTLSALKNKIVVLDFWATWCGPCKEAFPTMQQLINKYKDDKEIIFLFIDTWESAEPQKNLETVKKYMADKKYSFDVLFDVKKKVVADYKVEEIPKKIIIDRNGNLLYTGGPTGLIFTNENVITEMSEIIDAAKKTAISPNINNTKLLNPVLLHSKTKQK